MDYMKMIKSYADAGGDEKKMWASVSVTADAMDYIREIDPDKYNCYMRKLSEALYGKHYSEEMARYDVDGLSYTDNTGVHRTGAHWTAEQIESATTAKTFPKGTTKWDKYVAYNATYADLSRKFDEGQVLEAAFLLWFADEDWDGEGKIWDYMSIK